MKYEEKDENKKLADEYSAPFFPPYPTNKPTEENINEMRR